MQSNFLSLKNILAVLFVSCIVLMLVLYAQKYDNSIRWKVTSQAEIEEISGFNFSKGPFEFSLPAHKISIVESFSAGPIERFFETERALLILSFLGLALLLTAATFLKGFWHYLILGLFIFFFMSLDLGSVQFLGFPTFSKWGVAVIITAFVGPAYIFNVFFKDTAFGWRLVTFLAIGSVLIFFSGVDPILLQEQLAVGSYTGLAILTIIFILFIAEENLFALLYLVTKARTGRNNEKHFVLFALVYLSIVGLAYAKKAGWIDAEEIFFDPFLLLSISSLVSLWSISYKSELYDNIISKKEAQILLSSIGIASFGFLGYNFYRGNDAYFESFHYVIIYMHLGFGVLFFLYIISNFINPLIEGLQIYKIVYKSRNLPYSSARIGGMVAVLAFFLLSDMHALRLLQGGKYNFLGAKSEIENEPKLASEYYRNGRVFAYGTHFSNYAIGYERLQKGKYKEANNRFGRATLRFPSAQSYVNQSSTYSLMGEVTSSTISLKEGLIDFPNESHLLNNLGLTFLDLDQLDSARKYFASAKSTGTYADANRVNYWRAMDPNEIDQNEATENYEEGNTAVKANILAQLLASPNLNGAIDFETTQKGFPMHEVAYLSNAAFYFGYDTIASLLQETLKKPLNNILYEKARHNLAILEMKRGNIISSIHKLDLIQSQADKKRKGEIFNELGLVALSQNAPQVADDFFIKAILYENNPARFNRIIAAMELSNWDTAEFQAHELVKEDSSLIGFYNDLMSVNNDVSDTKSVLSVYYNYDLLSLDDLEGLIKEMDQRFAYSLFGKIFNQNFFGPKDVLEDYLKVFDTHIDLNYYRQLISGTIDTQTAKNGLQNPFDVPLFLTSIAQIEDKELAYNYLSQAIEINPYNIPLMKGYVISALDLGLKDFALGGMRKLELLLEPSNYTSFEKVFEAKIDALNRW